MLLWIPGEDELAGGFEAGGPVESDRRLVGVSGPHVAECDSALLEHAHGAGDQRFPHAPSAVPLRDVDLGDLTLQPGAGIEEDDPAEAHDSALSVADGQ